LRDTLSVITNQIDCALGVSRVSETRSREEKEIRHIRIDLITKSDIKQIEQREIKKHK